MATVSITASNISTYFTVTNSTYYFAGSGSTFTTNNAGVGGSTAQTILTAKQRISSITFYYSYSSEPNYDKFTLTVGGTTVDNAVSSTSSISKTVKKYTGSLAAGAQIVFKYVKDGSTNKYDDKCTFYSMSITLASNNTYIGADGVARAVSQPYIGVSDVARKVINSYVGVNNVARNCFANVSSGSSSVVSTTSTGTLISSLSVGTSVYMPVAGTSKEWIIVHHGNPDSSIYDSSCNGTWLMMKNLYKINYSGYINSQYDDDLGKYLNLWGSEDIDYDIKEVIIPYYDYSNGSWSTKSGSNGYSTCCFALSSVEMGAGITNSTYAEDDGAILDYFNDSSTKIATKRKATYNGSYYSYYTRSALGSNQCIQVTSSGGISAFNKGITGTGTGYKNGIRLACIVSSSKRVDANFNLIS